MDYVDNTVRNYRIEYTTKDGEADTAYEYDMKKVFERRTDLKRQGCTIVMLFLIIETMTK